MKATRSAIDRIEDEQRLDSISTAMAVNANRIDERGGAFLRGDWLGYSLHPALTDLPVGFWTSSFMLDLVGGRSSRRASQRLIALGILSVVPTAAAGLVDWRGITSPSARRVGVVHALSNTTATVLYTLSWHQRRRGNQLVGVGLGLVAATAATVGGYLGGHLAFGSTNSTLAEASTGSSLPPEGHELDGMIDA